MNSEPSSESITSEIIHCEERLLDAIRNSDIDHLDFLIHDDLIFIGPDGVPVSKIADLEKYRSETVRINELVTTNQHIKALGDTAVVSVEIALSGKIDGEIVQGNYQYLRVWKSVGNSWQVIAGCCARI